MCIRDRIKQVASYMKSMDDPRLAYQQMQADFPHMGRGQRSEILGKASKLAFGEALAFPKQENTPEENTVCTILGKALKKDQEEALTMADRIILMNNGVIEQEGSPQDIYSKPTTAFSANFIGTTNLFKAKKISSNSIEIHGSVLECNDNINDDVSTVTIRPEDIKISDSGEGKNILSGTIKELEFLGSNIRGHIEVNFESDKAIVLCNFAAEFIQNKNIQTNASINISLQPHAIKIVKE